MTSRFEGWYFRHQCADETLALIAGKAEDSAFIQVVHTNGTYVSRCPLSQYRREGSTLQIAHNRFSPSGISLCLKEGDIHLTGELRYGPLTPIRGDIMGPFRFFPMQCRHTVVSMSHALTGSVDFNGKRMDFTGGKGYIEGDSGRSFPESYTWVMCNTFSRECAIMASAARIPFGPARFWGCIAVILLEGREYRLATYRGAKIKARSAQELSLYQGDLALNVRFLHPFSGYPLAAPVRGKMQRTIHETPAAPAYFELTQKGRAVAVAFAKEGADVAIVHLCEPTDAQQTIQAVEALGRKAIAIQTDLRIEENAAQAVAHAVSQLGGLDILVNNAAVQYPQNSILDITKEQLMHTFESNFFSYFYVTKAALPHLSCGSAIINTASITAFEGNPQLIDYSASKGAIVAFTRSMALSLMQTGVRVNAVAPGPVWTPLIVSSFSPEQVQTFGSTSPMQRAAQPYELAPAYVFLASEDASNITGQVLHVNSGTIIN